jgi:hypothetical protein
VEIYALEKAPLPVNPAQIGSLVVKVFERFTAAAPLRVHH